MRDEGPAVRLVIDTNVWLDWLVFDDPDIAPLREAVSAGWAEVVMNEAVETELARVLAYSFGVRTLSAQAQAACLAHCRRIAVRHEEGGRVAQAAPGDSAEPGSAPAEARRLPVCADPDDQKFLDLALACGAACLVTRDRDILELARHRDPRPPFSIVTPRQLLAALAERRLTGTDPRSD